MRDPASVTTSGGTVGSELLVPQYSLAESITVLAPHFPRSLVPPAQLRRIVDVAALLPPVAVAGFECRLADDSGRLDLAVAVPTSDPCFSILAGRNPSHELAPVLLERQAWRGIRGLCRSMGESGGALRDTIDDLWLEFDLPVGIDPGLDPSVFFATSPTVTSPPSRFLDVVDGAIELLGAAPLPDSARCDIQRVAGALPAGAAIFQTGISAASRFSGLRLCIAGLSPGEILPYLHGIGWEDRSAAVGFAISELTGLADELFLDIDIGHDMHPRVGLETHFRGPKRPAFESRWGDLLDWLVGRGLCSDATRRAFGAWSGTNHMETRGLACPAGLRAVSTLMGSRATMYFLRGLHHVKITCDPDGAMEVKGYFGFKRHWMETPSAVVRPQVGAAPRTRSSHSGRVAISDAIAAGVDFLVGSRNPDGWWEDFDIADGTSDAWVSAYAGHALAGLTQPRATDLARGAWRLLNGRHRPGGGWGYNAAVPPDADTTAWAILLAESVGAGATPRVEEARSFLGGHLRSSGGLATYATAEPVRDDMGFPAFVSYAGWTSAHPCVTAVAANAESFRGRFDRYLWRAQKTDGSWPAYWWLDREYSTSLAMSALRDQERADFPSGLSMAMSWVESRLAAYLDLASDSGSPTAFPMACCLKALALGREFRDRRTLVEGAIERLLDTQLTDASWTASARLRIPPPDCLDPDQLRGWDYSGRAVRSVSVYHRRVFTTASVLSAISLASARMAEPTK